MLNCSNSQKVWIDCRATTFFKNRWNHLKQVEMTDRNLQLPNGGTLPADLPKCPWSKALRLGFRWLWTWGAQNLFIIIFPMQMARTCGIYTCSICPCGPFNGSSVVLEHPVFLVQFLARFSGGRTLDMLWSARRSDSSPGMLKLGDPPSTPAICRHFVSYKGFWHEPRPNFGDHHTEVS